MKHLNPLRWPTLLLVGALIGTSVTPITAAEPPATAFTYQGQLVENGIPVDGRCDFDFALHGLETGGELVAAPQVVADVPVAGGLFTAVLDFGPEVFTGAARWLEIAVRCPAGAGEFTPLAPRQAIRLVPYAGYALSVDWAGIRNAPAWIADGPYTAGPGLTLAGSALQVDTGLVQSRVTGTCPDGAYVREIRADGSVVCGVDADIDLDAGDGLALTGDGLSVDASIVRVADLPALVTAADFITRPQAEALYQIIPGDGLSFAGQTLSADASLARVADASQIVSAAGFITGTLAEARYAFVPGAGLARSGNTLSVMTDAVQGWVPLTLEPGGFGRAHVVCTLTPQRQLVWLPRQVREAEAFATLWARNLRAQGFVRRHQPANITSQTHADALARALSGREVPVPIAQTVVPCADGTKIHRFTFPDDLPRALRPAGYRQAEAALKAAWPDCAKYGLGVCGQGVELHTRPLPACTCNE